MTSFSSVLLSNDRRAVNIGRTSGDDAKGHAQVSSALDIERPRKSHSGLVDAVGHVMMVGKPSRDAAVAVAGVDP